METIERHVDVDLKLSWFVIRKLAVESVCRKVSINKLIAEVLSDIVKEQK